jgi:hypothetical protein
MTSLMKLFAGGVWLITTAGCARSEPLIDSVAAGPCLEIQEVLDGMTALQTSLSTGLVQDPRTHTSTSGCIVHLATTWTAAGDRGILETLRSEMTGRGWAEDVWYAADGPDGTAFRLLGPDTSCFVRGSWDGGDPFDSSYVASDSLSVSVGCAAAEGAEDGK